MKDQSSEHVCLSVNKDQLKKMYYFLYSIVHVLDIIKGYIWSSKTSIVWFYKLESRQKIWSKVIVRSLNPENFQYLKVLG